MDGPDRMPEEHIERIRREKFRLGKEGRRVRQNPLAEDLKRAIDLLSEGLYSKQTHFILELIQNAEDNQYSRDTRPDLTFVLASKDPTETPRAEGALVILNNESGFRPPDVAALCAVGSTTKTPREGYVGEKGIGFKSVFVVSSRPHIFSGGYQFRFQEEPDREAGLGYIVPYWVARVPDVVGNWGTCIILPLKTGKRKDVERELVGIAPETILFLNKLQGLSVRVGEETVVEVVRDDDEKPLVKLHDGDRHADYWIVEESQDVPAGLEEDKRERVTSRKVSVALLLSGDGTCEARVFAFLPTEVRSGLPFLINADFILSTSRESIQFDRPWNRWLRDCVAPTFLEAFDSLLEHPDYKARAYSFIPFPDEARNSFFQDVVVAIIDNLCQRPVVWTFGIDTLAKPLEARLATPAFRKLLSPACLPDKLKRTPLVHPDIAKYRDQLEAIGVRYLSNDAIIECLKDNAWLDSQDMEWFAELYRYLSKLSWATKERLEDLNLLPLDGGGRSSVAKRLIYLPPEDTAIMKEIQSVTLGVEDLAFLDATLHQLICEDNGIMDWVSDTLGVRELTPSNCCLDLARRLNARPSDATVSEVVKTTRVIRDQFCQVDEHTQGEILRLLPIAVSGGIIVEPHQRGDENPLVMPEAVDSETGWQLVFPDPEDRAHMTVMADAYLEGCDRDEKEEWREFFANMGATDVPAPRPKTWNLKPYWNGSLPPEMPEHAREFLKHEWPWSTTKYHRYKDWLAPSWLATSMYAQGAEDLTATRARALLAWLESLEEDEERGLSGLTKARHEWSYHGPHHTIAPTSTLRECVRCNPWFSSTRGLKTPGEVFLDRPELRELFGDTVPYALQTPSEEVSELLGLRTEATSTEFIKYLLEASSRPPEKANRHVIERIYRFLSERWTPDTKEVLAQHPFILVSVPEPRWITAHEAVWPDLSVTFGEAYAYLKTEYGPRFWEFFVEQIGIAEEPDQQHYVRAWTSLIADNGIQAKAVEAVLEQIYPILLKVAVEDEKPQWWEDFCATVKVWTQSDRFVSPGGVYVPDDGDLKSLFSKKDVDFAWRPEKASFADYQPLYRSLGVHSLVESVHAKAQYGQVIPGDAPQTLLTRAAKEGICFYLRNTDRNEYQRARETGTLEVLLRTCEKAVGRLSVSYRLDSISVKHPDSSAYWEMEEGILYRSETHSRDQLDVDMASLLARRLTGGRSSTALENFIGRILGASQEKLEAIKRKHNWSLPHEEHAWIEDILGFRGLAPSQPGVDEQDTQSQPTSEEIVDAILGPAGQSRTEVGTIVRPQQPEGEEPGKTQGKAQPRGQSKLRTYVVGNGVKDAPAPEISKQRREVDAAGIQHVIDYERSQGRDPEEKPHQHKGYDVESSQDGEVVRYIEVKSLSGEWGTRYAAGLTKAQFNAARKLGQEFWLYVVERATSDDWRVCRIQDPANRVNQYLFDDGWAVLAEETETHDDETEA